MEQKQFLGPIRLIVPHHHRASHNSVLQLGRRLAPMRIKLLTRCVTVSDDKTTNIVTGSKGGHYFPSPKPVAGVDHEVPDRFLTVQHYNLTVWGIRSPSEAVGATIAGAKPLTKRSIVILVKTQR